MSRFFFFALAAAPSVLAISFMRSISDVQAQYDKRQTTCPFNAIHVPAAPFNPNYPYAGAYNGLPSTRKGNYQVPAAGDTAHNFVTPGPNDIRGPCPGLNAAANHNFLSHDGIVTFTELVDAQQNIYNVGYDLAVLLAVLGIGFIGDPITGKLSIGCDATSRTAALGSLLGTQGGLNSHNKFEADSSLTRSDYFFGDHYSFNSTLFNQMSATAYTGGARSSPASSQHRLDRYEESKATNPNFYFGPKAVLLYGAASFLYECFPSHGSEGVPAFTDLSSFFGTSALDANGNVTDATGERIPANWFARTDAYNLTALTVQVVKLYAANPVLIGGNVGVNNFNAINFGIAIQDGRLTTNPQDLLCLLYQLATDNLPESLDGVLTIPSSVLAFATGKLNPIFRDTGCTLRNAPL